MTEEKLTIDELTTFCKRKGFVFKSSEIYGGFSGFWDYGPLGSELFKNVKDDFWNFFVHQKENMVGIEASIISHPKTWKASGHVANFNDMMIYDRKHRKNFRVDHLVQEVLGKNVEGMKKEEIMKIINDHRKTFESKGYDLEDKIVASSLMFKTEVGPSDPVDAYMRGETAQAMFMNFKLTQETTRQQLPFGIVQVGRCFRNEIAPRDFLFRSREFTIGEFEFFINPNEKKCELLDDSHRGVEVRLLDAEVQEKGKENLRTTTIGQMIDAKKLEEWHGYWLAEQLMWFGRLGLDAKIKIREHMKSELSHYSSATFDLDYEYPFGSKEVGGNANRGQYDLTQHTKESGEKFEIVDEKAGGRVLPKVVEPTFGMDRVFLALLCNAYNHDKKRDNIVLKLPAFLAPYKAAVFPLISKGPGLEMAREVYRELLKEFNVLFDKSGSIGRRYSRNDEIGTPYCITVDEESLSEKSVTVRDRDTTKQIRVKIANLRDTIRKLINGELEFEEAGEVVETRVK